MASHLQFKDYNLPVMTFQEIADELGISRQAVHISYCSAIRKLRSRKRDTAGAILADIEQRREYARSTGATRSGRE